MKFRTIKYFLKEGLSNIWKNKWMSAASAVVVLILLSIFGLFFLTAINADKIFGRVEDQPIEAFIVDTADSKTVDTVKKKVEKISGVKSVTLVSKVEGLNKLKQDFEEHKDLLSGLPPAFLPDKLVIKVNSAEKADSIKAEVEKIKEVTKVNYAKKTMEKLLSFTKIARIILYALISVLGIVALFIIIYTIKLTVFARRREIIIMKYVGATDWFIKWPFVIEGVIIGLMGAFVSLILVIAVYDFVYKVVGSLEIETIKMVLLDVPLKKQLLLMLAVLGSGIGSIGSVISVRKYLDV